MKKLTALFLSLMLAFSLTACGSEEPAGSEASASAQLESTAAETESTETESTAAETESAAAETESTVAETESTAAETESTDAQTEGTEVSETESESVQETEGGNTLVVYFSSTGNTEEAANYIAAATGADVFELEPVQPYTDEDLNYGNEDSRVSYEHDNPDARNVELVADTVENWDSYDTVFIGYPIWWV